MVIVGYLSGDIPYTWELSEVEEVYKVNADKANAECIKECNLVPIPVTGIIMKNHGLFCEEGGCSIFGILRCCAGVCDENESENIDAES